MEAEFQVSAVNKKTQERMNESFGNILFYAASKV